MAAEGELHEFDDLLKLFDVIEEQVKQGREKVKVLNDAARRARQQERDENV